MSDSQNQGGEKGGADYPVIGMGKADHLTKSELRYLQRHITNYGLPPEDQALAVTAVRECLSSECPRDKLRAVEVQLAIREDNRKEEIHAVEMEERLRALESDQPPQPQQLGGLTIINQVAVHPMVERMQKVFAADQKDEDPSHS